MAEHIIKMPDVGEGVAEAELVEWNVKVGDLVREDTVIAAVMTDKATVEIPSPVEGQIAWLGAEIGDTVAVGSPIVKIDVAGDAPASTEPVDRTPEVESKVAAEPEEKPVNPEPVVPSVAEKKPAPASIKSTTAGPTSTGAPRPEGERPLASPAVRLRAKEAGIDLRQVSGTGPAGRISHEDLDIFIARGREPAVTGLRPDTSVEEIKVVGL